MSGSFIAFAYGYVVATLVESFCHDFLQHRGRGLFLSTKVSHFDVHHVRTFKSSHVKQFDSDEHRMKVDDFLEKTFFSRESDAKWIQKERYGLTLTPLSQLRFAIPFLPFLFPVLQVSSNETKLTNFVLSLIPTLLCILLSSVIHPVLHQRYEDALAEAGFMMRLILSLNVTKSIYRAHWMHHRYLRCNFNLLPGGDFIRGVFRNPSQKDVEMMRVDGIPVD